MSKFLIIMGIIAIFLYRMLFGSAIIMSLLENAANRYFVKHFPCEITVTDVYYDIKTGRHYASCRTSENPPRVFEARLSLTSFVDRVQNTYYACCWDAELQQYSDEYYPMFHIDVELNDYHWRFADEYSNPESLPSIFTLCDSAEPEYPSIYLHVYVPDDVSPVVLAKFDLLCEDVFKKIPKATVLVTRGDQSICHSADVFAQSGSESLNSLFDE